MSDRKQIIAQLSEGYFYFLNTLQFDNDPYMEGMKEARAKFVANYHIALTKKAYPKAFNDRRYTTDYVSEQAYKVLKTKSTLGLCYEHMIPKGRYIKKFCEVMAEEKTLTIENIREQLDKYLWTATITEAEDSRLSRTRMPSDWDSNNIKARYDFADIELKVHNKDYVFM